MNNWMAEIYKKIVKNKTATISNIIVEDMVVIMVKDNRRRGNSFSRNGISASNLTYPDLTLFCGIKTGDVVVKRKYQMQQVSVKNPTILEDIMLDEYRKGLQK